MCGKDPVSGFDRCWETNNYGEAAVTSGAAAATWGVAGCTINGCVPPYTCNTKTKLCEPQKCLDDMSCPSGYHCDKTYLQCK